jgi:hypothetical protein
MKKIAIFYFMALFISLTSNAQRVTIKTQKAKVDSSLFAMVYNNVFDGTFSNPVKTNGNTMYTVDLIKWNPDEAELDSILNNDGSVTGATLVLKFPESALASNVSTSLPYYQYVSSTGLQTMNYAFWFNRAGLYTYNGYCYTLTQMWIGSILTGTQIKQILDMSAQAELMGQYDEEFIDAQENGVKAF